MSNLDVDVRGEKTTAVGLPAPFPWFGGKSRVAPLVWSRFGEAKNYVEPFFGSGAVLLGRPIELGECTETVNDIDGYVANFWRATKLSPREVAKWADWPVNENDLHAGHAWLVAQKQDFTRKLEGDPDFHDVRVAGWWVWGISCWIGSGWCSGIGPWTVDESGMLVKKERGGSGRGVNRQLPHLSDAGHGVHRRFPRLGNAGSLVPWFEALADRLRRTRVCCGDWSRVCGPSVTTKFGLTAVFLDPPYADTAGRYSDIYAEDSLSVAHDVRKWAIEHGGDPMMRIALCGYEGEHEMPGDWECVAWKAHGGYGAGKGARGDENKNKERIWFSPHCLRPSAGSSDGRQLSLLEPA